jgi:hypothetical protein
MTVTVKHSKTNAISDWTQAQLDEQIELGNFAPGTTLADIVLPSDWNNDHTFTGTLDVTNGGTGVSTLTGYVKGSGTSAFTASATIPNTDITGLGTISTQNANSVAITGGTINGTTIGATTASTGTFTTLIGGANVANYGQLTGGATTKAVEFMALGTDSNISLALDSKGTGAIDLVAGSSGVNISNGGTVTAITRTSSGGSYTSIPSVAITAPTTAGGVQATATATMFVGAVTIQSGGTGYTVGNVLTLVGGTNSAAATLTVSTVSAGVITAVTVTSGGTAYSVLPTNPVSVTGGSGSGATFNVTDWRVHPTFTITNAGSGYIEQPTITFSGGGGSGAAAYATVGSGTIVRSLGNTLSFTTPGGEQVRINDSGATAVNYWQLQGRSTAGGVLLSAQGSDANIAAFMTTKGTGSLSFTTNNFAQEQLRVSHTASAVNYVQVTGNVTTGPVTISSQGSDTNVSAQINTKGTGSLSVFSTAGTYRQFRIDGTTSSVNYLDVWGSVAGSAPSLRVAGSDTNIDLALTPKGTGLVRFGTYVAGALTATGYINIKAADGTTYKVLVST